MTEGWYLNTAKDNAHLKTSRWHYFRDGVSLCELVVPQAVVGVSMDEAAGWQTCQLNCLQCQRLRIAEQNRMVSNGE